MTIHDFLPTLASMIMLGVAAGFGLASWRSTRPAAPDAKLRLTVGDITDQHVDVIVNAAKPSLMGGGGVDGAIHKAGGPDILAQCRVIRAKQYPDGLPTGHAVATGAGTLNANFIIHTVGPVYSDIEDRSALLRSAYTESMNLAEKLGATSIAFPLISSGVYGWPVDDAVEQFRKAITSGRPKGIKEVRLVVFDQPTFETAKAVLSR